jgi:hypothetical protein
MERMREAWHRVEGEELLNTAKEETEQIRFAPSPTERVR